MFLIRPLPGVVPESQRQTHVGYAPPSDAVPDRFRAYCDEEFARGDVEPLDRPAGMPCVSCLRRAPFPSSELSARSSDDSQERRSEEISERLDAIDRLLRRIVDRIDEITRGGSEF